MNYWCGFLISDKVSDFVFCVMVMLIKENKKSAYLLVFSSIIAIVFSAGMQLFADLFSKGSSKASWITFATFCISVFASAVAVIAAVEFLIRIKNHINQYLLMICGISIITIIDGIIYYPLISAVCSTSGGMGELSLTSFIGKAISLGYGLLMLYFINCIEKRVIRKNI